MSDSAAERNTEPIEESSKQEEEKDTTTAVAVDDDDTGDKKDRKTKEDQQEEVKDSNKARDAFANRDPDASRAEHEKRHAAPEEHKGGASDYVKAIVFGGLDGIITTFAIVTAAAGAGNDWKTILVFGFANVLADAWSMGFGEFISGQAEYDYAKSERDREMWEVEHFIEGEKKEMREIYEQKGYSPEDAETMVDIISKDPDRFVDVMMIDELGLMVDLDDRWESLRKGIVMFLSFIAFGIFPLIAYLSTEGKGVDYIFGIACGITGVALLILGGTKGFLTSQSIPLTAIIMLFNGCVSGLVSFGVGVLVTYLVTGEANPGGH